MPDREGRSIMKGFAFFAAFCFILASGLAAQPQSKTTVQSVAGNFSIESSYAMAESSQIENTAAGPIELHFYTTEQPDSYYLVSYSDYPSETIEKAQPENVLNGARDGAVARTNGQLVYDFSIRHGKIPGREFMVLVPQEGGNAVFKMRIFLARNRLYQMMVGGTTDSFPVDEADAFLHSFKILE